MGKYLKYRYVFDENDELVIADQITEEDKRNHTYHIKGLNSETGEQVEEPVYPVLSTKRRKYFRRYPKGTEKRSENFVVNKREYNETVLHKLAKKVIKEQFSYMTLPQAITQIRNARVQTEDMKILRDVNVELEKTFTLPDKTAVRYDAYITDIRSKREVAIEFAVTHKINKDKADKIRELNHDVIEIDLSHLLEFDVDTDLATEIKAIIEKGTEHCSWVNNKSINKIADWDKGQIMFKMDKTEFQKEKDGKWLIWAGDRKEKLKHCKYRYVLASLTEANIGSDTGKRYLCESECRGCDRLTILNWDGTTGTVLCNQSDIDNSIITGLLLKGL